MSLVAPAPVPKLSRQTTAELVPVLVFVMAKSRVVPPTVFEPSRVTQSAPLRVITHEVLLPLIEGLTPDAGLIVIVLVEFEPEFALIVIGKVSDG